jgi:calcineurin-like phosphoesterase family protein
MISFFKKSAAPEHQPKPLRPTYVVGDIHGCIDALNALLEKINLDSNDENFDLVIIGDMIDRGQDSAAVLARLQDLPNAICLKGNHEQMALDFLDDPITAGPRWIRNGGDTTLLSFGIPQIGSMRMDDLAHTFRNALPSGTEDWLRQLPHYWQSGNLVAAHAGLDPRLSVEDQTDKAVLWGQSRFRSHPRTDGLWVVHGHWIQSGPSIHQCKIGIDIGTWRTGCLTAVRVDDKSIRFIEVV